MIYAGFKFAPVPNWDSIMTIKAPSNYKRQEAIDDYIAKRRADLVAGEAATNLLTGSVVQIAVREGEEGEIKLLEGEDVLTFFYTAVKAAGDYAVAGYRIHRAMKILALMYAQWEQAPAIPVHFYRVIDDVYNKVNGFIDPVSLLFGTTDIDLFSVAARCGVSADVDDPRALVEFAQVMLRNVDIG